VTDRPLELLHAIAGSDATFRAGQREAIDAVVNERRRVLLVQRTGWGSRPCTSSRCGCSAMPAPGPTILVSPLLALMRNQIRMAERAGVRAFTINRENCDESARDRHSSRMAKDRHAGDWSIGVHACSAELTG
jgi:ATP-dependent DNA helicase RecQ